MLAASGEDCRGAPDSAPTCPWGLKKYQPGEWLVLVDGVGRWVEREISSNLFSISSSRIALQLDQRLPMNFFDVPNRGWVASVDRVFYRLQEGTIERRQCWGMAGSPATVGGLSQHCGSPLEGTEWEPLLRTATLRGSPSGTSMWRGSS